MSTHNVTGNHLNDKSLNVATNSGPPETINVFGVTEMHPSLQFGDHLTVNLTAHSEWIGGFSLNPFSTAVVNGPGVFDNTSTSIVGSTATIRANVIGAGTFSVSSTHGPAKLEFLHSVSAGQTVLDSGDAFHFGGFGLVQVDDPLAYHAQTDLNFGELVLEGLKATSFSYNKNHDLLTLFNGNKVVDTLKVQVPGPFTHPSVSQVGSSINIHDDRFTGGHALPLHA